MLRICNPINGKLTFPAQFSNTVTEKLITVFFNKAKKFTGWPTMEQKVCEYVWVGKFGDPWEALSGFDLKTPDAAPLTPSLRIKT